MAYFILIFNPIVEYLSLGICLLKLQNYIW